MSKKSCMYESKDYSDGSEICQAGTVKRCIDGDWVDIGRECNGSETRDKMFDGIREINDDEMGDFSEYEEDTDDTNANELIRYAEFWSIRKAPPFLYFKGAKTIGYVCSGLWSNYKVPLMNVVEIGEKQWCDPGSKIHWYRKITFLQGG